MLTLCAKPQNAEKAKRYLLKHRLYNKDYRILNKNPYIYLPLVSGVKEIRLKALEKRFSAKATEMHMPALHAKSTYRELLAGKLPERTYENAVKSYDQLGDIAIIDAEPKLAKIQAAAIMKANSRIKTVLRKGGAVKGKLRIRKHVYVAGKRNFIATYKENNCTFVFDVRKVFFSSRLSFERNRIMQLVKPKENVMVMFAGVGPFAIEIGKAQPKTKVVAIELNKYGCKAMKENIILNKTQNVIAECGDVAKLAPTHKGFANRIAMPLPWSTYEFLPAVAEVAAKKCIVHYYAFAESSEPYVKQSKKVRKFFKERGFSVRIKHKRIVRPYSSKEVEICLDVELKR